MKKTKKWLLVSFVIMSLCIPCLQPLTVHAEETVSVTGGANNTAVYSVTVTLPEGSKSIYEQTLTLKDDWEIVGYIDGAYYGADIYKEVIYFLQVKAGTVYGIQKSNIADCSGYEAYYDDDGELTGSIAYSIDYYSTSCDYKPVTFDGTIDCKYSGFKLFSDKDSLMAYAESGSLDGMLAQPADIDNGIKDTSIGYLHNLKYKYLQVGGEENIAGDYYPDADYLSHYFTWDDTYPKYDDFYKVEMRASCTVTVKKYLGLGKKTDYTSDILHITDGVYNELSLIIASNDLNAYFEDFIQDKREHWYNMAPYTFTYYFRIYIYDEEIGAYRYGQWVRLLPNGDAYVWDGYTGTVGDIDDDGNWTSDPGSDYGDGVTNPVTGGSGDDLDSAIEDAEKNEDAQLDLSLSNIGDIAKWLVDQLSNMVSALGQFPNFIASLFSFLPPQIIAFIAVALMAVVVCRFLGR